MSEPIFAVVGHANPGKSSVVSTLAADDSVRVGALPGTTQHCRKFPMRVSDEVLYTLVDTPGFERPRQMLSWLKKNAASTSDRKKTVQQFCRRHQGNERFRHECELLQPVLDGAAILYVVDGSKPPSAMNEAEMEILRWTGQPRMALINPVEVDTYTAQWRDILDQYFNLVRVFDAHRADFDRRLELLGALRELNDRWRENLDKAIQALQEDRRRCLSESARAISEMLADLLTHTAKASVSQSSNTNAVKKKLEKRYYGWLRSREQQGHATLKEVYEHHSIEIASNALEAVQDDLFSESSMNRLGLSKAQLIAASATAGAAVGGVIDAGVGGASFLVGTVIGGATGAVAGYLGMKKLPKAVLGGDALRIGPMANANFPWVVLDRAIVIHHALAHRAHANRSKFELTNSSDNGGGVVKHLPAELQKKTNSQFQALLKQGTREAPSRQTLDNIRNQLARLLEAVLEFSEEKLNTVKRAT